MKHSKLKSVFNQTLCEDSIFYAIYQIELRKMQFVVVSLFSIKMFA